MSKSPRSGGGAGQIRIIGGQWRGRKLPVPDSAGLRPTTDRVRETLFNWLAPDLPQARCLDCFAGSGALGLEALSRYAGSVTLLELERSVAQQLSRNVVFVDPPFRKGLLAETLALLERNQWLSADALIYVESEVEQGAPDVPASWQLYREKIAGQVAYRLYQRQQEAHDVA
ncbi:16S rRNA (guanine(966)-N(2))-methyltransferase RsmD [Pantoea eucrina]|uniref:16S rRNA (guanine(966)-N(2))-methyltransferase RsmD n=1 Tax=Pantoea eucrina TaxID=472693 RepID=UPI002FD994A9